VAIANGNASFAADTWIQTGTFSANRTVTYGELLAIVVEYDGSGRLGADSFRTSHINTFDGGLGVGSVGNTGNHHGHIIEKIGGTWRRQGGGMPNIVLEFTDGSFGTIYGGFPFSALGVLTIDSSSTPDECALEMAFSRDMHLDGAGWIYDPSAGGANLDLICYRDDTPLTNGSRSLNGNNIYAAAISDAFGVFPGVVTLSKNLLYRLALKPTTTTPIDIAYFDVAVAGHLQVHTGHETWSIATRTDGGAWTKTTTRRLFLWPMVAGMET